LLPQIHLACAACSLLPVGATGVTR